jgi:hypothetical protein
MHDSARQYVATVVAGQRYARVVEVGSKDINGSIRELVDANTYVGIDLEGGPGVDVVADCRFWEPPWKASLVLCLEVLEHAPEPRAVVGCLHRLPAPRWPADPHLRRSWP